LIEWSRSGDCFFIRDQDEFCAQVLSKYFRHTKLTSFQRQLNLYGFRRITKGPDTGAYSHPLFSRDDPSHVDTIKRVVRKGAGGGSGTSSNQRNNRNHSKQSIHGASPNSSHSFPDNVDIPPPFSNMQRQLSSSWPHHSTSQDEYDDEEDEEEEYIASRRRQQGGNAYSRPYFTQSRGSINRQRSNEADNSGSGGGGGGGGEYGSNAMDVPNQTNKRNHRYGTRGASYDDDEEDERNSDVQGGSWNGGYPHSAPSPNSGFGGDGMMIDPSENRGMPMPPPNARYQAPLSPQQGAYSHPLPSGYNNQFQLFSRGTSSDMVDGSGGGGGGGLMLDGIGGMPKIQRSTSALSAELNVSLAGSESWGLTGSGPSALDLKDLDDLDQFYFDNSFDATPTSPMGTRDTSNTFAMEM